MLNRLSYYIDELRSDGKIDYDVYLNLREMSDQLGDENAVLRERLEKMVELPCKIGDRFYVVNDCPPEIKEHECCAFTFTEDGQVLIIDGLDCRYSLKIVYLSKEDAEACLEELKGE